MYWQLSTQAPPRFYLAKLGEGLGEKRHDRKWWTRFVMMATCPHTMQPVIVIERTTNTKQKTFYVKDWEHARCFALKQGVTVILSPGLVPVKSLQLLTNVKADWTGWYRHIVRTIITKPSPHYIITESTISGHDIVLLDEATPLERSVKSTLLLYSDVLL